jgi:hypothetical protein
MTTARPCDLLDLLNDMESWRQDPEVERNRAYRRFPVRGDATLESLDASRLVRLPITVMLRDISRGGTGFICDRALTPGSVWRVGFNHKGFQIGSQPIVIRFCREVQDGLYLIGGQFVIEPAVMIMLGVNEEQLGHDVRDREEPADTDFLDPDDM